MEYSVVIAAYNAADTIEEAVQSVLDQTVAARRIIVVDDGSTDDTAQRAARCSAQVQVIRQANTGPGAACSAGLAQAGSPLIATLDADDIWLPHKIARQIEAVQTHPETALFFTKQQQFHHADPDRTPGELRDGLNRSSMLMRRTVFDTIGDIIDPVGGRGDMVDWRARAREHGFGSHMLDEVLCLRRIIPTSLSYGRDREKDRGLIEVAYRAMQRRKARSAQNT